MRNTVEALRLFAEAKALIDGAVNLLDQYNEIGERIAQMGYAAEDEEYPEDVFPSYLSISTGCMDVESGDFLDRWIERGPVEPRKPAPNNRRSLHRQRERLGNRSGWMCFYCHQQGSDKSGPDGRAWHVDHAYPLVRGGDDGPDNLVLACATCNLQKLAKSALEFMIERA